MIELRFALVAALMLVLPGWAILAATDTWRLWDRLQRWCVAVGLSIAFYPVLFYSLRTVVPALKLGPYKITALLVLCTGIIIWRLHREWRDQVAFDGLEWLAIAVVGITIFTRFWIIREHPFPAWSDSLHHVLLTQITATTGQLPYDLQPYAPIPLNMYHLGLYALSATVQWLAQLPAHSALLWTAQLLSGLCGVGVFLVLDRKVSRFAAVIGVVVVGLLSHQPAFYVNWGRFTQLASQTILLIAWLVSWEAIAMWRRNSDSRTQRVSLAVQAGLLTGAVFLLHFRAAGFYLPLLAISVFWELWQSIREHRVKHAVYGIMVVGTVSLLVAFPALLGGLAAYNARSQRTVVATAAKVASGPSAYYDFPLSSIPYLAAHQWLLVLAGLSALFGTLRRNKIVWAALVWIVVLISFGSAYRLGVPLLRFTNMGAILMMLYLPIGLIIGAAAHEVRMVLDLQQLVRVRHLTAVSVLIIAFVFSYVRAADFEPYRDFVTDADVKAMAWIDANMPPDALFAINTDLWLPRTPIGTDGGYWIPYFAGRATTAGNMLFDQGNADYRNRVGDMSEAVVRLSTDNAALDDLRKLGVDYIYVGKNGNFAGKALNSAQLSRAAGISEVYQQDGVSIWAIH
jgi:hypothetical protein